MLPGELMPSAPSATMRQRPLRGESGRRLSTVRIRSRGGAANTTSKTSTSTSRATPLSLQGIWTGKSSLAFGTLYAEAQRRYLESVSPMRPAVSSDGGPRRRFHRRIAAGVALQQQRGTPSIRSSIGSVTTLSNLLADALFAGWRLSAAAGAAPCGGILTQYA